MIWITPPLKAEEVIVGGFRQIMKALKKLLSPKEPAPPPAPKPGSLLSTEEAAAFLGISPESLRRLCRRKAITFIQVLPGEYRFHQDDLAEYVDSRRNRRRDLDRRFAI
jgi:excisionase family DNA binding protein